MNRRTGDVKFNGGNTMGELTNGSLEKIFKILVGYCDLNQSSIFLDVGSGVGLF